MLRSNILNHKYLLTLLLLLALIVLYPLNVDSRYFIWVMHTFFVIYLSFICYYILPRLFIFSFILLLGLVSSISAFLVVFSDNEVVFFTRYTLMFLFYLSTIIILLHNITQPKIVTKDLLMGSLCVYILIAIFFGSIFIHIEHYHPHSFDLSKVVAGSSKEMILNFIYFSFTTLCTVGFGDIVPVSIFAKGVVIIEEISGIFYLALLVSRLANAVAVRNAAT